MPLQLVVGMHVPVFPVVFTVQDLPPWPLPGVGLEPPVFGWVAVPGRLPGLLPELFLSKPKQTELPSSMGALYWFNFR